MSKVLTIKDDIVAPSWEMSVKPAGFGRALWALCTGKVFTGKELIILMYDMLSNLMENDTSNEVKVGEEYTFNPNYKIEAVARMTLIKNLIKNKQKQILSADKEKIKHCTEDISMLIDLYEKDSLLM